MTPIDQNTVEIYRTYIPGMSHTCYAPQNTITYKLNTSQINAFVRTEEISGKSQLLRTMTTSFLHATHTKVPPAM